MKKILYNFKQFSKKVSSAQIFLILTVVYIAAVPFLLIFFYLSKPKTKKTVSWLRWNLTSDTVEDLKKQF